MRHAICWLAYYSTWLEINIAEGKVMGERFIRPPEMKWQMLCFNTAHYLMSAELLYIEQFVQLPDMSVHHQDTFLYIEWILCNGSVQIFPQFTSGGKNNNVQFHSWPLA